MKTFFLADTHFGHEDVIKYENRPFNSVEEMDLAIIKRWNDTVSKDDKVFLLGDLSIYDFEKTQSIIKSLNGIKILIKGNHDTKDVKYYMDCGFDNVYEYPVVYEGFWILSHEPMYINDNMPYANIYGHVHGNEMYKDYSPKSFCVSVERIDYTPIEFEKIKQKVTGVL